MCASTGGLGEATARALDADLKTLASEVAPDGVTVNMLLAEYARGRVNAVKATLTALDAGRVAFTANG